MRRFRGGRASWSKLDATRGLFLTGTTKIRGDTVGVASTADFKIVSRSFSTRPISTFDETAPAGKRGRLYLTLCVVVSSFPPSANNFSTRSRELTLASRDEGEAHVEFLTRPRGREIWSEPLPGRLSRDAWMKAGEAICIRGWSGCREKERGRQVEKRKEIGREIERGRERERTALRACVFLRFTVSQRERNAGSPVGGANAISGITSSQFVENARVNFVRRKACSVKEQEENTEKRPVKTKAGSLNARSYDFQRETTWGASHLCTSGARRLE